MRLLERVSRSIVSFWTVLILSLCACVAGIVYAVQCGVAMDGQRGGAVGVALSFLALFVARPIPAGILEDDGMNKKDEGTEHDRIDLLQSALSAMLDIQRKETRFLLLSSVISTLVWGFGDLIAMSFGAPETRPAQ